MPDTGSDEYIKEDSTEKEEIPKRMSREDYCHYCRDKTQKAQKAQCSRVTWPGRLLCNLLGHASRGISSIFVTQYLR